MSCDEFFVAACIGLLSFFISNVPRVSHGMWGYWCQLLRAVHTKLSLEMVEASFLIFNNNFYRNIKFYLICNIVLT